MDVWCVAVLRLLKEGVDPNTPISSGGSLLHLVRYVPNRKWHFFTLTFIFPGIPAFLMHRFTKSGHCYVSSQNDIVTPINVTCLYL